MPHIHGVSREAVVMFPPTLDGHITAENPGRVIDTFVDQLDWQALGFVRVVSAERGRPACHPGDLLKLYIYGYLNRVRLSRLLERETRCNVEVMGLLKKLTPDHKTIATFRAQQGAASQQVCREFTQVCKALDLFGGEFVAIDGSKFQAVNSCKRNFTQVSVKQHRKRINQWITAYRQELDQVDDDRAPVKPPSAEELRAKIEPLRQRQAKYEAIQPQLEAKGETQLSQTEPDSRSMPMGQSPLVRDNAQTVVDAK